jgi:3-oxoacyl-[acyl-carrier protein] reductase
LFEKVRDKWKAWRADMDLGLRGKRTLVLASSRGLGYACALGLAREGCDIVICSRDRERIEEAAAHIHRETDALVHPLVADVSRETDVRSLLTACVEQFGGVEIAVHNAGGPPYGDFQTVSTKQWYQAIDLNLMSFVWLVQAAVPEMKRAGYGRILAITSLSVKQTVPDLVLSGATRMGVLGVAKSLSKELAPYNILLNVVAPGRIATQRVEDLNMALAQRTGKSVEEVRQASVESIPLGRPGKPSELDNLVVFLASEAASYITGTVIPVDGGKLDAA